MNDFTCECGSVRFAKAADADAFNDKRIPSATGTGPNYCPICRTQAHDHAFNGDEWSDFRCYDCDTRSHRHGGGALRTFMVVRDGDGSTVVSSMPSSPHFDGRFIDQFESAGIPGNVFAYTDCSTCEGSGYDEDRLCPKCFARRAPVTA